MRPVLRLGGVVVGIIFLAGMGCATHPPTTAAASTAHQQQQSAGPVIYTLVSRNRTLVVTSGPAGPLYCLQDRDGRVLVPPSTMEQVAERNPEFYEEMQRAVAAEAEASSAKR